MAGGWSSPARVLTARRGCSRGVWMSRWLMSWWEQWVLTGTSSHPMENGYGGLQALRGGKAVLFSVNKNYGNFEKASFGVVSLAEGGKRVVLEGAGMSPRSLQSGQLFYVPNGVFFAAHFDLARLEVL